MLAKQGWRLMTRPESLCARVLKGRYYHDKEFMAAGIKKNSSHTWSAIMHGQSALNLGLIKRVGCGSSISIWNDPWIETNFGSKPIVRKASATTNLVVELIDQASGEWNMQKLEENFIFPDVQSIRRITIGEEEDIWAWKFEKTRNFTVRSAYSQLCDQRRLSEDPSSSGGAMQSVWKKLWKMAIPPEVRNFWWRTIHKFIPCRHILKERHVEKISNCEDCGEDETIFHTLFICTWAKLFWQEIKRLTKVKIPSLHEAHKSENS